tara:strand:- start:200 stop:403 length:204 start_codon:yes stop_codon:yes gene_type:complete
MAKMLDDKTKLASRGYTWGILGISESAYYKKTKAERLKLRRKAYNKSKRLNAKRRKKKKGFFARLFG